MGQLTQVERNRLRWLPVFGALYCGACRFDVRGLLNPTPALDVRYAVCGFAAVAFVLISASAIRTLDSKG